MPKDYAKLPTLFGEALQAARKTSGISQEALAQQVGLDRTYVSSVERGRKNPTLITMARLADGVGAPVSHLLESVDAELNR